MGAARGFCHAAIDGLCRVRVRRWGVCFQLSAPGSHHRPYGTVNTAAIVRHGGFRPVRPDIQRSKSISFQWPRSVIFVDEIEHIVKMRRQIEGQFAHLLSSKCTV